MNDNFITLYYITSKIYNHTNLNYYQKNEHFKKRILHLISGLIPKTLLTSPLAHQSQRKIITLLTIDFNARIDFIRVQLEHSVTADKGKSR